jgi:hypothetical protein
MGELRPCVECRRHVSIEAVSCPFCGAARDEEPAAALRLGRMSRAAVFAGAALASTACGGSKAKADKPIDNTQQTASADAGVEQPPPPPPNDPNNIPMPYGAPPARKRVV